MTIIDLEWNRSYDRKEVDEILQIGAVRLGILGGPVLDQFNVFVKPSIHRKFDPGAKKLPDLQSSIDSEILFPEAWEMFSMWIGDDRVFAFWGRDDFNTLRRNCEYWNIPFIEPDKVYNIQQAFAHAYGIDRVQMALWRVMDYLSIPDIFDYHNALYDAMYTALVTAWLRQEDLDFIPEPVTATRHHKSRPKKKEPCFTTLEFPKKKCSKIGPYCFVTRALNAKPSRLRTCPVCGSPMWVTRWYRANDRQYYSTVSCSEHGAFVCRLTLSFDEDGTISGRPAIPKITPVLIELYKEALTGEIHICKGLNRQKKIYRWLDLKKRAGA